MIHIVLNILVFILGCWAAIYIMQKNKLGYVIFFVQNFIWAALSIMDTSYGGAAACIFMAALDVVGYMHWKRGEKNESN